jgi:hypothetical protein
MGLFYFFFIQLPEFFVTILCWLDRMMDVSEANMNRLDTKLQNTSSISPPYHSDSEPTHRLIVLVPDADLNYAAATRRVWQLANDLSADIQFIGLYKDVLRESSLRRQLVTMTAMIQDGKIAAEAKVELGNNWVDVVKTNWQAGDVIVCFAEQHVELLHRPLSQILQSNLHAPIYILSDLYPQHRSQSNWRSEVAAWTGSIGIVISFGIMQAQVVQLPEGWFQNVLLLLSMIPEFWLIWVWNNYSVDLFHHIAH